MLFVLHNACEIYAGGQADETAGALKVEVLEVAPDAVCCFQDTPGLVRFKLFLISTGFDYMSVEDI